MVTGRIESESVINLTIAASSRYLSLHLLCVDEVRFQ